jgi:single-strand DNA-binding protein
MNSVSLVGNLGKDVEIRKTAGGNSVGEFSLATADGFGDNKKTNWHNLTSTGGAIPL